MKNCKCKSSIESHISHCVAEHFESRPKRYSKNTISKYLKLQEYFLNGINIYDLYLKPYNIPITSVIRGTIYIPFL